MPAISSTRSASSSKQRRPVDVERAVDEPLGEPDRLASGPAASRSAHSSTVASSSAAGHDLVDEADALGLGRGQVVAEEEQLLGLLQRRPGGGGGRRRRRRGSSPRRTNTWMMRASSAAMIRSHASASCMPPPAAVPLSAQITGFSQSRIAADQALHAGADHAGGVAGDPLGRALGARPRGRPARQVGAGAEVLLAGGGDDHGAHVERLAGVGRGGRSCGCARVRDGVARRRAG